MVARYWILVTILVLVMATGLLVPSMQSNALTPAVLALLGVALGSVIAGIQQEEQARATRQHTYRMAAIDKRLEAHQQAFFRWWKLSNELFKDSIVETAEESRVWWASNSLYLDPMVSARFIRMVAFAANHREYVQSRDIKLVRENGDFIRQTANVIREAMTLPPLQNDEIQDILSINPNKQSEI